MMLRLITLLLIFSSFFTCESPPKTLTVSIETNLEDIAADGYKFTPSTQSFLRGSHWMDNFQQARFQYDKNMMGNIEFFTENTSEEDKYFRVKNLPLDQLVPRLHYPSGDKFDGFDRFNLMMAEYSRNGLSMPFADEGAAITHFETNLPVGIPWVLENDYNFKPNPFYRPVRFSVVNNCLNPGLWELSATDKTGEVYHGWFTFPEQDYFDLVANVNNIQLSDAINALTWKDDTNTKLDLDRLRTVNSVVGESDLSFIDQPISYSSQGSRRKLSKGFVTCTKDEHRTRPSFLSDILMKKTEMCQFIPPGKYSKANPMAFDFQSFADPLQVKISEVSPLTCYQFNEKDCKQDDFQYIEIEIELPNDERLILGNLPLDLIVTQEDFMLHGFGVGILSASGFAERRNFLINQGFHPSFAYLAKVTEGGVYLAQNSHERGIEQIVIRSYPYADVPHWDITLTSYERITDIVKYRVPIPKDLIPVQLAHTETYITPVYFSYRDDNLR